MDLRDFAMRMQSGSPLDKECIGVLTGDLRNSTRLDAHLRSEAFSVLSRFVSIADDWPEAGCDASLSRSRGDGWQICLQQNARYAIRAALLIQAMLKSADAALSSRICMASGPNEGLVPEDLNHAMGPVFVASGRGLDRMTGKSSIAFKPEGPMAAATRLADYICMRWTRTQAETMIRFLAPNPPTRAHVASALGKSRQSIDQTLASAGYAAIADALRMLEIDPE